LVISDSHNVILDSQIEEIKKEGQFDLLIHCGDKYNDADKFAEKLRIARAFSVPGNCDYSIIGMETTIIQEIEGKKFVFAAEDDKAVEREVTTGLDTGAYIEIKSGLSQGDKVIVKGQDYISDGSKIKVVRAE